MALVPRIDLSRLSNARARRIGGDHHATEGMDAGAHRACNTRLARMASCALLLAGATAFAGEPADSAAVAPLPAAAQAAGNPAPSTGSRIKPLGSLIVLGAVADASDAAWVDDSDLPELPVIDGQAEAGEDAAAQPRATTAVSGADRTGARR